MTVFDAGDAEAIAEASAAMFSGKIRGLEIARALGATTDIVPEEWRRTGDILKSHPGAVIAERIPEQEEGVFPVFHCSQEIPCNPCTSVCPQQLIHIDRTDIRGIPTYLGLEAEKACLGCEQCVAVCPGLAITLVDYRKDAEMPTVTLAYEFLASRIAAGDRVTVLDAVGNELGDAEVVSARAIKRNDRTVMVKLRAPKAIAKLIAGLRVQDLEVGSALSDEIVNLDDDMIVCRCERVTAGEIRALIRKGYRDINEIKAVTRAGMGACGGKTCAALTLRLFREEGIPLDAVTRNIARPLFVEVPLGVFAGNQRMGESANQRITNYESQNTNYESRITHHEPLTPYSLLPTPSSDVIIIGAGSVGVPAALAMARAGLKVRVFDGAASQGQGSNKSAIGGVRATHSDPAKIRLCLRSLDIFSTWEETYGHNIEWTTGGYAFVAYREREAQTLKALLKVQHTYGLDIDWYDRDDFLRIVPDVNQEGFLGGTFSPCDGHCSPLLAGHAFYDAAKAAGALFHFDEPVTEILIDDTLTGRSDTRRADEPGDVSRAGRRQRRRSVGEDGRAMGWHESSRAARLARGRDHRTGSALSRSDAGGHPARAGVGELLLLPTTRWTGRVLHHAKSEYRRLRPPRDERLSAANRVAHGRSGSAPGEYPRAAHLARPLPDDAGRLAARRLGAGGGRIPDGDRDVRAGLHARSRPGRAAGADGRAGGAFAGRPGGAGSALAVSCVRGAGGVEVAEDARCRIQERDCRVGIESSPVNDIMN